ncbi:MAG: lysoplasmalogenase family protein, partial [Candidatus Helarchaeota archaeon]
SVKYVYFLAVLSFGFTSVFMTIYILTQFLMIILLWTASMLILVSAVYIRLFIIDTNKLEEIIRITDIIIFKNERKNELKTVRFFNYMPIAMFFCTSADFAIHIYPPAGIILFLVAHIFHILAFSGIIHLNKNIFKESIRKITIVSLIFWSALTSIIYPILISIMPDVHPLLGIITPTLKIIIALFILPYVIILTLMTILTFIHLGYRKRTLRFRLFLAVGASFFFFSDSIIGISIFAGPSFMTTLLIYPTYIIAIFLLQFAVLSLSSNKSRLIR